MESLAETARTLAENGLHVGSMTIPWSVIFFAVVIIVGLLLIRTAFTLIKVLILVGIAVAVFLLVKFLLSHYLPN